MLKWKTAKLDVETSIWNDKETVYCNPSSDSSWKPCNGLINDLRFPRENVHFDLEWEYGLLAHCSSTNQSIFFVNRFQL
ncbi:hypothetical protein GCK32_008375 [Trichostrongylus colubriformis]|uniref:Uncharacterized protein n=1 Tax=Trichostrongylus colubriformis TaxID=6319 RepID=A0AAN8ID04_TRICO